MKKKAAMFKATRIFNFAPLLFKDHGHGHQMGWPCRGLWDIQGTGGIAVWSSAVPLPSVGGRKPKSQKDV